jgi:hypothetical protein
MAQEQFPEQTEEERTGGQHGTRNIDKVVPDQPSKDPQLRRVHENAESPELPDRNDVSIEDGGARHRQQ